MNELEKFQLEKEANIERMGNSEEMVNIGLDFVVRTAPYHYSYNFTWMGRPIIALPQDMIAMQELIWEVKPDLIIETGVAHGGSIIYYASLMELAGTNGIVVGIDIDIREHNRKVIEAHPMFKRIQLIEGSSIDKGVFDEVKAIAKNRGRIMICLDSNHTHDHVLEELKLYAPLTSVGSYCIVFDTIVEDMPADWKWNRPWGKGNNPKTAVQQFLGTNNNFIIDKSINNKLLISVAPDGYLKKIK